MKSTWTKISIERNMCSKNYCSYFLIYFDIYFQLKVVGCGVKYAKITTNSFEFQLHTRNISISFCFSCVLNFMVIFSDVVMWALWGTDDILFYSHFLVGSSNIILGCYSWSCLDNGYAKYFDYVAWLVEDFCCEFYKYFICCIINAYLNVFRSF